MSPRKWLVAGLGNPLLGPDGFGPAVVERLRREPRLPAGTNLDDAGTDLLALFDRLTAFDGVVLVDAVLGDGPRNVVVLPEDAFAGWSAASANAHLVSPLMAVRLFRSLQPGWRGAFVVVGLLVTQIDTASPPTPEEVQAGVDAVLDVITKARVQGLGFSRVQGSGFRVQ